MRRFIAAYASGIFIATLLCRAFTAPACCKNNARRCRPRMPGPICNSDRILVRFIIGEDCVCRAWLRYYLKKTSRRSYVAIAVDGTEPEVLFAEGPAFTKTMGPFPEAYAEATFIEMALLKDYKSA